MIRKGQSKHKGFAFSGDDQGATVVRSLSLMNQKKINKSNQKIEEEKSQDGLELSLEEEQQTKTDIKKSKNTNNRIN